ncbi:cobalt-precorrin-5B (C(1))-methyltransferase [Magnetospira sp. QH-2]|uniref:cobalt-precorrin-5B (C(1))-methyltransferase n=1 Tax=Magnetospira sp. (strain QH-2) TaxID=1288970 RepID=UPI0003E81B07|nr:cobalt-precorrin-5B (C(1))-methyltransferase [Magnetospira sp. QH-2]CCQ75568.1 cobalt-precorrin-6A synthase CbiD [Magnetospira sp. QH-2]
MRPDPQNPLRKGWTTGACATAAATAAYGALMGGGFPDPVTIHLPRGLTPCFPLHRTHLDRFSARASVIKDAGDDPDVTHGAEIVAHVAKSDQSGITFRAGEGVGTITRPGLRLAVGEPAINPAPRRMIGDNIARLAAEWRMEPAVTITLSIPGGADLATRTLNGRLGIVGGLSILGTTGVVVPYSADSWIHSLHRGVDVALACGHDRLIAATGRASEAAARVRLNLPDEAVLDMGGFAGALFKYLRHRPVPFLCIAGGFAKMVKLAQGNLNLHSSASRVDMAALAALAGDSRLADANTAAEILDRKGPALADQIARQALCVARAHLKPETRVEILIVDREGTGVGHAA